MPPAPPKIGKDAIISSLISSGGSDKTLDCLASIVELDPARLSKGIPLMDAVRLALSGNAGPYTTDVLYSQNLAARHGIMLAHGTGGNGRYWCRGWLPGAYGQEAVMMTSWSAARAACAVTLEGISILSQGSK